MIPVKNWKRAIRKSIVQPGYALRNLKHRLKSSLSYHLYSGKSAWPETISIFLTYKCNLNCRMCGQWGENGIFKDYSNEIIRQRLSLDQIGALIRDVRFFKPNITLFGGEPMLYPGWLDAVKLIKSAGLRCNIVTNGTLVKRYAQDMIDVGLDEIIFSLDGPQSVHDGIRGIPGTHQKAMQGFEHLAKLKREQRHKKPLININSTLFQIGSGHIDDVLLNAAKIKAAGVTFHHLLFLKRETVHRFINFFQDQFHQQPVDWTGFAVDQLPDIDVDFLISEIHRICKSSPAMDVHFYPNFSDDEIRQWYRQYEFTSSSFKNRCMSLWMTAYIFPDGTVRPYHTMNFTTGTVLEKPFTSIWNNTVYRNYRKYIKRHKRFSICAKGCTEFFRY